MDMSIDIFAETTFGKIAIDKIAHTDPDFRLYSAGWIGDINTSEVMEVKGAVFRRVSTGKNKGSLSIRVPYTTC